jgi:hypothetical protein
MLFLAMGPAFALGLFETALEIREQAVVAGPLDLGFDAAVLASPGVGSPRLTKARSLRRMWRSMACRRIGRRMRRRRSMGPTLIRASSFVKASAGV